MSNSESLGRGWLFPSARKSIHDHEACIFSNCSKMTRYGLKTRSSYAAKKGESDQGQGNPAKGVDEVDNIWSKHVQPSSSQNITKHYKDRRNSYDLPYKSNIEPDSDSELLAKSLPADMPSYYCSDEFPHLSLPNDFYNGHNDSSQSSTHATNRSTNFIHDSFDSRSSGVREELSIREQTEQHHTNKNYKKCLLPIIGVISLVAAFYYNAFIVDPNSKNVYDDVMLHKEFDNIKEKYQINDNSILELQTGISTISERNDTGSFIFVYNSESAKFDQTQFNNFLEDITITTAKYLRNTSKSSEPTIVQSSQLTMKTHSELMNRYRNEVAKTGVMLVRDIDRIPSSLAMAFHYFCDEYNPLVAKTAIFFTLNLDRCASKSSDQRSTYTDVEKCLANKWDAIPKDNIKPLLARIVNVIVDLSGIL